MTRVVRRGKRMRAGGGSANGDGGSAPAASLEPMPLTLEHAFRRIAGERGIPEGDLFTRLVEAGLVSQAEQGQGWAVKLLLESLCCGEPEESREAPLSAEAGRRIYEILLAERANDT